MKKAQPKKAKQMVSFNGQALVLERLKYGNGRVALQLVTRKGEPYATATINLPDVEIPEGYAFIKDYSENAGMLRALVNAGVVAPTGRVVPTGFVAVAEVKVL